jgi:hypothetical protein
MAGPQLGYKLGSWINSGMSDDEKKTARAGKRGKRPAPARAGELWAKCPECRMPVKDAELFKHLLNCPGADARQAEWAAEQAAPKPEVKPETEPQAQ